MCRDIPSSRVVGLLRRRWRYRGKRDTINLALAAAGRYALAFSFDGYFPRVFSRVNRRFGTPHNGLLLVYLMTVCTLLVNPPLMTLGSVLNFGLLFMVTLVLFAAVRLLRRHPATYVRASVQVKPRRLVVCSSIAIAINCVYARSCCSNEMDLLHLRGSDSHRPCPVLCPQARTVSLRVERVCAFIAPALMVAGFG
jgi:amino acid transporter